MPEYTINRITKKTLEDLIPLYKSAFNKSVSIEYLSAKYTTQSFGKAYIGFIAYDRNGLPAGYYGVFPCQVKINNEVVLAAQSGDTMTHKDHQGKGLFTMLARATYDLAKSEGIKFVFGFPNKNSYPGFIKKLDWKHVENLSSLEIKVNTVPVAKIPFLIPVFYNIYELWTSLICSFYKKGNEFEGSVTAGGNNGLLRDHAFYNYKRYYKKYLIKLVDKNVWMRFNGSLWIGDIELCTEDELRQLLKKVKRLAFYTGCNKIIFHLSQDSYFYNLLKKDYVLLQSLPIGYIDFDSGLPINTLKFTSADFDTF